ncbi:hypothetical protein ARMGADRAFT_1025256 [Armillaria gallica]|uniref:Uncharacterized protein n=1 Tax=Armillaria gallica TaxID=47427 RepID=A0A2H3EI05_ARMGA|nr:hypothetical protein ARMGADRAFT_1025256 [Armillaria gallica]
MTSFSVEEGSTEVESVQEGRKVVEMGPRLARLATSMQPLMSSSRYDSSTVSYRQSLTRQQSRFNAPTNIIRTFKLHPPSVARTMFAMLDHGYYILAGPIYEVIQGASPFDHRMKCAASVEDRISRKSDHGVHLLLPPPSTKNDIQSCRLILRLVDIAMPVTMTIFVHLISIQVRRFRTLMAFYVIELENIVLEIGNTGTDAARTDQSTASQLSFLDSALYVVEQAAIVDLYRLKPKETLVSTLLDARSMLHPSRSSLGD